MLFANAPTDVVKALMHFGAEMGTFEPGMFLTWRMPPASIHLPHLPGLACAVLGQEISTCCKSQQPKLGAAGCLAPHSALLPSTGRRCWGNSVPRSSCLALCELVNSPRHGCSLLWERAEALLNHPAGISILTAAPGLCCCTQTPRRTRKLHLGHWLQLPEAKGVCKGGIGDDRNNEGFSFMAVPTLFLGYTMNQMCSLLRAQGRASLSLSIAQIHLGGHSHPHCTRLTQLHHRAQLRSPPSLRGFSLHQAPADPGLFRSDGQARRSRRRLEYLRALQRA